MKCNVDKDRQLMHPYRESSAPDVADGSGITSYSLLQEVCMMLKKQSQKVIFKENL